MEKKAEIEKIYALSPMQEGMLFSALQDQESRAYFEQFSFVIEGKLEIGTFEESLNLLIKRYEILRTVFVYRKLKNPRQVVLKKRSSSIFVRDISHLGPDERKAYLEEFKRKDREDGFDLTKDILMRMAILRTGSDLYRIIWSFHHIIMDGWCFGIVLQELFLIYGSLQAGRPLDLPEVRPYSDYIKWLEKQDQTEALLFWNEYLADYELQAAVPRLGAPVGEREYQNQELRVGLDEALTGSLINLAKRNQVTLNIIMQSIWGILLQRYNNVDDVVFGAVVSGRPPELTGVEKIVGLFVNTVPVRVQSDAGKTFTQLVAEVQQAAFLADKYKYLSLAQIQSHTRLKQGLIDHLMAFENYPLEETIKDLISGRGVFGFRVCNIEMFEQTIYDFNLIMMPGKELIIRLIYNGCLFDPNFILKIGTHFQEIAKRVIENDDRKIAEIEILADAEKRQILFDFNNTQAEYSRDRTIQDLFEEQVETTPDLTAVVFEGQELTYRELNQRANRLARSLRAKGVTRDTIVAIIVERSLEMIIGLIGILKAGGAYLPVDPEFPMERVQFMLEDSGVSILLTQRCLADQIQFNGEISLLEDESIDPKDISNPEKINQPSDLLYVIYTSGSTGSPKGIMLEQRNLLNLIHFEYRGSKIDFGAKVSQFATISFDVCYQEIFSTLLAGGELHVISNARRNNPLELLNYLNNHPISVLFLPTTYVKSVLNEELYLKMLPDTIRHIITAGEQLIITEQLRHYLKIKNISIHNHYGPSETHVVTTFTINPHEGIPALPPIGKPIDNTQIYILNRTHKLQPIGIAGELYISGDNVGRGYLKKPDLTAEMFVPNPFIISDEVISDFRFQISDLTDQKTDDVSNDDISEFKNPQSAIRNRQLDIPQSIMYRTGDLARWMPDGNIEYLGRLDHQVKIRGFRIELGEIENQLLKYELIKETVVIAREGANGNKYLCAYVVCDKKQDLTEFVVELKEYLSKKLPGYMMPSYFIRLGKMPLTPSGKVDQRALPEPQVRITSELEYVPPGNEIEAKMAAIWAEALGKEKVGILDNFFDSGGTSLTIFKVLAGAYQYNWGIAVQDFFNYPTIKQLSDKIKGSVISCIFNEEINHHDLETVPKKQELKDIQVSGVKNHYQNILLTGATGFLGSYLLNELLETTEADIYCLVRGENKKSATRRLFDNLDFYFQGKYTHPVSNRIFVIHGDIALERFGLTEAEYHDLTGKIDNIIHAAALAKNFGHYSDFERDNVLGTKNIINFSLVSGKKLDYISSLGVVGRPKRKEGLEILRYTENDFYIGQNYLFNPYIRTKFEAENLIFKAIKVGLDASIYRVGILSGRYSDGVFQINIQDNTFYNFLKSVIELGIALKSNEDVHLDFTPVDYSSKAIVALSGMKESGGKVFHIINHNILKANDLMRAFKELGITVKSLDNESYQKYLTDPGISKNVPEIIKGAVNYNDEYDFEYKKWVLYDSEITREYLRHLNFEWPKVTEAYIKKMIEYMRKVGFLSYQIKSM
jgi:amino acid adenylation domain-containing protein/thioester reductase-like protein